MALHDKLRTKVAEWRDSKYESEYTAISEILDYNYDSETRSLHYLRKAQFEALENYWYLRLTEGTPHIFDLYTRFYTDPIELLNSFGIPTESQEMLKLALSGGIDSIFEKIKSDDAFVKNYRLEAVRETLALAYPSYILALAMSAGKTMLIGTIIATEFAMALEYPDGPFVNNALVVLVNYGKTSQSILNRVEPSVRDRTSLIGEMRPRSKSSQERFKQIVEKAISRRYSPISEVNEEGTRINLSNIGQIQLSWGALPEDLDLHLRISTADGEYEIYFEQKGSIEEEPWAQLDKDVVSGFGPENIEIAQ